MSHSIKRKPTKKVKVNLDEFEFSPSGLDLQWTKDLITVLDGYRIHRTYDLSFIEKGIGEGELPRSFMKQYKVIRAVLHKFAGVGPQVPDVKKLLTRRQIIQTTALITITIAFPLLVLTWVFNWSHLEWFAFPFAIGAGAFLFAAWTAGAWYNRKIAWKIQHYIQEHEGELARERHHLKEWVTKLIGHAKRIMRKEGEDPDDHPIKFFMNDYPRITVVKEPNWHRKHYEVLLKSSSPDSDQKKR